MSVCPPVRGTKGDMGRRNVQGMQEFTMDQRPRTSVVLCLQRSFAFNCATTASGDFVLVKLRSLLKDLFCEMGHLPLTFKLHMHLLTSWCLLQTLSLFYLCFFSPSTTSQPDPCFLFLFFFLFHIKKLNSHLLEIFKVPNQHWTRLSKISKARISLWLAFLKISS